MAARLSVRRCAGHENRRDVGVRGGPAGRPKALTDTDSYRAVVDHPKRSVRRARRDSTRCASLHGARAEGERHLRLARAPRRQPFPLALSCAAHLIEPVGCGDPRDASMRPAATRPPSPFRSPPPSNPKPGTRLALRGPTPTVPHPTPCPAGTYRPPRHAPVRAVRLHPNTTQAPRRSGMRNGRVASSGRASTAPRAFATHRTA